MSAMPRRTPPEQAQVGFICDAHDLEVSTGCQELLPAEPRLPQTWPTKVARKQFDHGARNANLTHLPLIS